MWGRDRPSRSVLITGAHGFVGRHATRAFEEAGLQVAAPTRQELDLLDEHAVRRVLRQSKPDAILHLAAEASVARAWSEPLSVLNKNLMLTGNLLEGIRVETPGTTVLLVGSGEVYGAPTELPVTEAAPLAPRNPYAVSKAAADLLGGQYAQAHGLNIVRLRPFNHAGPGQSDAYLIGTLARQVAEARLRGRPTRLHLGRVDVVRDFTDVRDVVRAYLAALALEGGVYNICSGVGRSVQELVDRLAGLTDLPVDVEVDPKRLRPDDVMRVVGSSAALAAQTSWEPRVPIEETLRDSVAWWHERLSSQPKSGSRR